MPSVKSKRQVGSPGRAHKELQLVTVGGTSPGAMGQGGKVSRAVGMGETRLGFVGHINAGSKGG
jgi:transketolase